MDTPTVSTVEKKPSRTGWIVTVVALILLALASAVRSMSPHISLGTSIEYAQCQGPGGEAVHCYRHVERGDWLVLAPVDDYQIYLKGNSRYHSVGNPWVDDREHSVTVEEDGRFSLTDGRVTVRFMPELFDTLKD